MFIVETRENLVINNATGETAVRRTGTVDCACPACGTKHAHPAVQYREPLNIYCVWCAHKFSPAA